MIITVDNMYDFASKEFVDVECSVCNKTFRRKMVSIRSNLKANGEFLCHNCRIKDDNYLKKQKSIHDGMRKIDKKYPVVCSICGKNYELAHRTVRSIKKSGKPIVCKSCAVSKAHVDGKYNYDALIKYSPVASKMGINSEAYKNKMEDLRNDESYKKLMSKHGKIGSRKFHNNYTPEPSLLSKGVDDFVDWVLTFSKFGVESNSVPHDAKIIIRCPECDKVFDMNYKTLKKYDSWSCFSCRRKRNYHKILADIGVETSDVSDTKDKILVKCQKCGNESERVVTSVLEIYRDKGHYLCLKCAIGDVCEDTLKERSSDFIKRASKIYPYYDYSKAEYTNKRSNITVICKDHGEFDVLAGAHINNYIGCPKCSMSVFQRSVGDYIESFYDIVSNDRTQISPLELDIYVPEKKFAVECHGIYWHSFNSIESSEERRRHSVKCDRCCDVGIDLFQVFEHEWRDRGDVVRSMILNRLGGSERVFARKCELVGVSSGDCFDFMDVNHLQGGRGCSVAYGLMCDGELVCVVSFGRHKKFGWEISRFANRLGVTVVGGASRLFKRFLADFDPDSVLSYADRRFSGGGLYGSLGFALDGVTRPNYFYVRNNEVFSRQRFQKHKLVDRLEVFDPGLSEADNMFLNGFRRFWDAGHFRFVWMAAGQR